MTAERNDIWAAGKFYEPYVGRWSRLVAKEFLAWVGAAPNQDWLDIGCGTGALTEVILDHAKPRSVRGMDPSAGFVEYARAQVTDPRATFDVADAQSLPVASAQFDVAVAGLVLNFVPRPLHAVREMARVVRPGGVVAAYVWDYAGKMELMRYFWDAAVQLDPLAVEMDEGIRFPLCRPEALTELFATAGLDGIGVTEIDIATLFASFADYWQPFLGGQGPAPAYAMSRRCCESAPAGSYTRTCSGTSGWIDLLDCSGLGNSRNRSKVGEAQRSAAVSTPQAGESSS